MHLTEYARYDAVGLAELVTKKEVTSKELASLALQAIDHVNADLNATIQTFTERVDSCAASGPFSGVPMLNKDIGCEEKGVLCEMGSKLALGNICTQDSLVFSRFRQAGFINLGRTTTPEFGLAGVTENSVTGISRNPWNRDHTPGGSSGGSCAMVAAGAVPIATASDAGGSIRSPASHSGLVGLKPTRGRIPAGPSHAESLNGLGTTFAVTRTMRDCAATLDAVQGAAIGDPYKIAPPARPYMDELGQRSKPMRIAYSTTPWVRACDPEVDAGVKQALSVLEDAGHHVEEARPEIDYVALMAAALTLSCASVANSSDALGALLDRKPGPDNLQSATWAFYEVGKKLSASDVLNALDVLNVVNRQAGQFFESYDVLVLPSCLGPAPLIGALDCDPVGPVDPHTWNEQVSKLGVFMPLFNVTGQPAISLPLHQSSTGLPIGVQFAAKFGDEARLFALGGLLEEALPWADRIPPLHVSNKLSQ
ncbi:amidase [Roseovarius arcticus]|uniref:amidase n=1 Tax=Roseovarius arcticus TaxID=2547404 RepID=UPI001110A5A9|nr:amidase [Roseovarius arcticus]